MRAGFLIRVIRFNNSCNKIIHSISVNNRKEFIQKLWQPKSG